ncbi:MULTISPECIES: hypothetical protein [unclassified Butyrivibrio]|uniref:hypothetical protein n=1 Tax=unclassified Butyrivibrio TaxID=2639466 RepID=UPI0003B56881|nr:MULTISPECIES: hypothetical protein [unclassified Butyrivibrio]SDB31440.1 hypothetical protein SAMN02910263_01524 [Butyrivibrio sp. INlla16]SEK39110.1 hypothetical protein SAMN04487770_101311 [Butyrivibrio sp. ob235]
MEFKQELETGLLKQIGNNESELKIREVASKCRLLKTENGLKVELSYTGPNASKYLQYVEKHREELTNYLLHPDDADLFEWMEASHQTSLTLRKHEKEKLILYVNFDPETMVIKTGIADENVTMKLGTPLMKANISNMTRNEFKLAIYDMLLLADEISIAMDNSELKKMANIEMVKVYLSEIYDKYHEGTPEF